MGKILYKLTIFSLLTMSCQSDNNGKGPIPTLKDYETEVISQTIVELIHPGPPEFPQSMIEAAKTDEDLKEELERITNSYQQPFDTTILIVYLVDSLREPYGGFRGVFNDTVLTGFEKYGNTDTLKKRAINVKKIDEKIPHNLIPNKLREGWPDGESNIKGKAEFSRIIFNQDYTLALFYFDFDCGPLCGSGHLVLTEKKKGKWKMVRNVLLSVE
jgi:hypothetical protein